MFYKFKLAILLNIISCFVIFLSLGAKTHKVLSTQHLVSYEILASFTVSPHGNKNKLTLTLCASEYTPLKSIEIYNLTWKEIASLNLEPGELIEFYDEKLDYSDFGKAFYNLRFCTSGKVLRAKIESYTNLNIEPPVNSPLYIFNLKEDENSYTFVSEGNIKWQMDKQQTKLKNGNHFFIDYSTQKNLDNYVGAASYEIVLQNGIIAEIIGGAKLPWEPSEELQERVFLILEKNRWGAKLQQEISGKQIWINNWGDLGLDLGGAIGERIFILDQSGVWNGYMTYNLTKQSVNSKYGIPYFREIIDPMSFDKEFYRLSDLSSFPMSDYSYPVWEVKS